MFAASVAQDGILVDRRYFDCLMDEVDKLPENRRKLYVTVYDCKPRILSKYLPDTTVGSNRVERVLALDPAELRCMRANRGNISRFARIEGGRWYRLFLSTCQVPRG
jgi:hypothetical protein